MKKIFAFAVAFVLLLSLSSVAFAKTQHKNLLLQKIVVFDDVAFASSVTVKNDRESDFGNGKVILLIPELDARASGRISVNGGSRGTGRVLLDLPKEVPAGDYWVRIVVAGDDATRIRHRLITIE